jgi:hypothetical protein
MDEIKMANDISNQKAVKFLSVEFALSFVISVTLVGVAWGTLASSQKAQGTEILEIKTEQAATRESVEGINVSLATVAAKQQGFVQRAEQAARDRQRIEEKLDKITEHLLSAD